MNRTFLYPKLQWPRVLLAALLFGFVLNSVAHVAHEHEPASLASVHDVACGYCAAFGGLADATVHTWRAPAQLACVLTPTTDVAKLRAVEQRTSARPRAPPLT